jgi:hypothetical protein
MRHVIGTAIVAAILAGLVVVYNAPPQPAPVLTDIDRGECVGALNVQDCVDMKRATRAVSRVKP